MRLLEPLEQHWYLQALAEILPLSQTLFGRRMLLDLLLQDWPLLSLTLQLLLGLTLPLSLTPYGMKFFLGHTLPPRQAEFSLKHLEWIRLNTTAS
jgi:hypothetical protein